MNTYCIPYILLIVGFLSASVVCLQQIPKTDNINEKIAHGVTTTLFFIGSMLWMIPGIIW